MKKFKVTKVLLLVIVLGFGLVLGGCDNNEEAETADETVETETDEVENDENESEDENVATDSESNEIIVGTAMSINNTMEELVAVFSEIEPNITVTINAASSGALQTQIEEGAPIDVFFSAARGQMNNLVEQDLIYGEPIELLENEIVLIVPLTNDDIDSFEDVDTDKIGNIGYGDPESTPFGTFAEEIFDSLGLLEVARDKAVLGSDVNQVLNWVEQDEVDAGVVFRTDAVSSDSVRIAAEAPAGSYTDPVNPVAIVEASDNKDAAGIFIEFLQSDTASEIFTEFGFTVR